MRKIIENLISLFLFVFPIFFIPFGTLDIILDKNLLLLLFSLMVFLLSILHISIKKKHRLITTPLDFPLIIFVSAYVISTFLFSQNKINAIFQPFSTGTIVALVIFYFALTNFYFEKKEKYPIWLLTLSSIFISLIVILQEFINIPLLENINTPLGNALPTFMFLFPILLLNLAMFINHFEKIIQLSEKKNTSKAKKVTWDYFKNIAFSFLIVLPIFSAWIITLYHILTDQKILILPFQYGWSIMLEAYKNIGAFFFGVGPSNYSFVYNLTKPVAVNSTPFWNYITQSSTNFPLTIATEVGIIAFFGFVFLFIRLFSSAGETIFKKEIRPFLFALLGTVLMIVFTPGDISILILFIIFLSILSPKTKAKELLLNTRLSVSFAVISIALSSLAGYYLLRFSLGNLYSRQSNLYAQNNDISKALDYANLAKTTNPNSDKHFSESSKIHLFTALSLQQSQNASESAEQISFFTQTALNDAQIAVNLNRFNVKNWEQLTSVYANLIDSAEEAPQLTLQAYNQQISLNPTSPVVRLNVGQFLMQLQEYNEALNFFNQAINLKPDWNLAHYHAGHLLGLAENYEQAVIEMEKALTLTPKDTEAYKQIEEELNTLKPLVPKESTPSSETE